MYPYISLHLPRQATMYSRTHAVIQCGYYADAPTTAEERGLTLNPHPHPHP